MKTVYFKYLLSNGDGVGKGWTDNLANQQENDTAYGYVILDSAFDYTSFDPALYYFVNNQITPKTQLYPKLETPSVEVHKEPAIISWQADKPVRVLINGQPHPELHENGVEMHINVSGTHEFKILDSRYFSQPIRITAEDYGSH